MNECPKIDGDGKDKFWAARKEARTEKQGVAHAVIAATPMASLAPATAPTTATSIASALDTSEEFERFQWYMDLVKAKDNMRLGCSQVGNLYEKEVTFASVQKKPGKRFMLDSNKLYLNSYATYHSAFVRNILENVKTVGTVLQGNCNAGVSTSQEKGNYGLWNF